MDLQISFIIEFKWKHYLHGANIYNVNIRGLGTLEPIAHFFQLV